MSGWLPGRSRHRPVFLEKHFATAARQHLGYDTVQNGVRKRSMLVHPRALPRSTLHGVCAGPFLSCTTRRSNGRGSTFLTFSKGMPSSHFAMALHAFFFASSAALSSRSASCSTARRLSAACLNSSSSTPLNDHFCSGRDVDTKANTRRNGPLD